MMNTVWFISCLLLWGLSLFLALLVFGVLGWIERLQFHMVQLEARLPRPRGRSGLPVGSLAPDFSLFDLQNQEISLHEFLGRTVLLIFTQTGCSPCHQLLADLNGMRLPGKVKLVVIHNGQPNEDPWPRGSKPGLTTLVQTAHRVSRLFQWFHYPSAFVVDEKGVVRWFGVVFNRKQLRLALGAAERNVINGRAEVPADGAKAGPTGSVSSSTGEGVRS